MPAKPRKDRDYKSYLSQGFCRSRDLFEKTDIPTVISPDVFLHILYLFFGDFDLIIIATSDITKLQKSLISGVSPQ